MLLSIIGVDPGIVHTGIVRVSFDVDTCIIGREAWVVDGLDIDRIVEVCRKSGGPVIVEKYVQRLKYGTDEDMMLAEKEIKRRLPNAVLLDNTGVKKVVPQGLLEILGLWHAPARTHHQDLRSAARILVKAMMRDEGGMNTILADVVYSHLKGTPWSVSDWEVH